MKRILLLLSILINSKYLLPSPNIFSKNNSLSIKQAVGHALKHRPDLEALQYAIQANKSGAKAEIAGWYPTINLTSDFIQETGQSSPVNTTLLQANQLIYSFAGPQQKYRRAKNIVALSELEKIAQSNRIQLETEKSFLQAWLVQEQSKTIQALATSAQAIYERAKNQNKVGLLDKNEWLKNVEDYGNRLSIITQYNDNVQTSFKKLEFLMGRSLLLQPKESAAKSTPVVHLDWQPKKKMTLKLLETYYDLALKTRPEITQGLHRMAIEQQNIKLSQGQRLPVISATAIAGHVPSGGIVVQQTVEGVQQSRIKGYHSVGVSVSWQLFDGLVTQHQERQAEANKVKEMLARDQIILDIKQEVQDKYFALSKELTKLKTQKLTYLRNNNEYKLRQQEFEIGQISRVDFQAAQTTWYQAQLDWLASNFNVAVIEQELMFACGYPYEAKQ